MQKVGICRLSLTTRMCLANQKCSACVAAATRSATFIPCPNECLRSGDGDSDLKLQARQASGRRANVAKDRPLSTDRTLQSVEFKDIRRMKRLKLVWRLRRVAAIPPGAPRLNCLAALISAMALGILWLTFHAKPAGAGHELSAKTAPQLQISAPAAGAAADTAVANGLSSLPAEELSRRMHTVIHSSKLALQLHVALLEV